MKDDVVNVMWGGDWRIPTADECRELIENCTCTMDSINGVKGFRVPVMCLVILTVPSSYRPPVVTESWSLLVKFIG